MTDSGAALTTEQAGIVERPAKKGKIAKFFEKYGMIYLFVLPFLILFVTFYIAPVLVSMGLSFTYFNVLQPPRWIGLTNYINLFLADDVFVISVWNTLKFALVTGPVGFMLSFFFAWLITSTGRARLTYTLVYYAPSIAGGMTFVWLLIFSGDRYGILNYVLMELGVLNEPFLWTTNVQTIMPVIMFVALWSSMGTGFLAQLAGLQSIPQEAFEAGMVDGVPTRWHELWYITLPMMKPYLLVAAVLQVVASFNVFAIAREIAGFPSTLYAGHTIVTHLWDYAFLRFEMGYSSAIAMVLFTVTFGLNRFLRKVLTKD